MLTGTDQFRNDLSKFFVNGINTSEGKAPMDKIVDMFKKSIPRIQRFLERKFDLDLKEQDNVFQEKEVELTELEEKSKRIESKYITLRNFLKKVTERTEALAAEVSRDYISRSFLREEKKITQDLHLSAKGTDFYDIGKRVQCSLITIVEYLQATTALKLKQRKSAKGERGDDSTTFGKNGVAVTARIEKMSDGIKDFIEKIATCESVPSDTVRGELDFMLSRFQEILDDMFYIREVFIATLQRKEELTDETLSLIHNYREVQVQCLLL